MRIVDGGEVLYLSVGELEVLRILVDLWKEVLETIVEDGNALLQLWK
jgi:hypothetical protein